MDTKSRIIEIMAGVLKVSADVINDDTAVGDIVEWDSLHHLQIIAAIEKEYGFRFMPDEMMDMEDVSDIVGAVEKRLS